MKRWLKTEEDFLIKHYPIHGGHFCAKKLNKKFGAVKTKANKIGLRRIIKKENVEKLLLNDPISLYWIGFLLADGNFVINHKRKSHYLRLRLSIKDIDQVIKFKNFLESDKDIKTIIKNTSYSKESKIVDFTFGNKELIKVCKKFNINNNKTIYPPKIETFEKFTQNQLLCLMIGFIDGDGTIFYKENNSTQIPRLRIKNHISWKDFLIFASEKIMVFKDINPAKIRVNKQGYVELNISNLGLLQKLKTIAIKNNLPLMNRKWGIIDLNRKLKIN